VYRVRPDTCCLGACVRCRCSCAEGSKGKCCRIPFLIRDPATLLQVDDAEVTDLWSGFKNECCTQRALYAVKFPREATPDMRATLLSTALLIDLTLFEQEAAP